MNCVLVCVECNSKFNINRNYWFNYWCSTLSIDQKVNLKEAKIIAKMDKKRLINFMKDGYKLTNGKSKKPIRTRDLVLLS